MPFKKFLEVGRVAYCVGGPVKGKLVAIVDIIDYNRALIDGPCTDVPRQEYRFMNLQLTGKKIKIQHSQRSKLVRKAWIKAKIDEKWKKSTWYRNVEKRRRRESLTDFDRFKVAKLKRQRNKLMKLMHSELLAERRKARLALKPKMKAQKKAAADKAEDPDKRKLRLKVNRIYRTLRMKGVLNRNKPKKEKKPVKKKSKKLSKKRGKKPIKKPSTILAASVKGKTKKPVVSKKAPTKPSATASKTHKAPKAKSMKSAKSAGKTK